MTEPTTQAKCGGSLYVPSGDVSRSLWQLCPGCPDCAPSASADAERAAEKPIAELKRYRLSYRYGVTEDNGSDYYGADYSLPMVLASEADALLSANASLVAGLRDENVALREQLAAARGQVEALLQFNNRAAQENFDLREIIMWALGERDEFPARPENWADLKYKPWYWWRKELRARLDAIDAAIATVPAPPAGQGPVPRSGMGKLLVLAGYGAWTLWRRKGRGGDSPL